jgi:chitinase
MSADKTRTYYISAAPQCPRPDASIPLDAMQSMDFVFVQFYNNGDCNVGQSGFVDSFKAWSSDLSAKGSGPKLYIGAPGCSACAGSGYVDPTTMTSVVASVKDVSNLGGVMLWDGPEAVMNKNGGQDYIKVMKSALT